ncbi:MAG: FKBP-type peptidyl-prolyl cis-trans isomerase [Elusimicrobiota bacterium]|nr:MAG: FKBP-type peptidyl-prolyl cis-trans isomerase [Elusimicrobiota bacterium]
MRPRAALAAAVLLLAFGCSRREEGVVRPGSTVRLDYKLDVDGKPFESTELHGPIEIIQGAGDLPEAVDRALVGMRVGQRADIDVPAGAGYGPRDEAKVESLPLASLGPMGAGLTPGKKILGFKNGKPAEGVVLEVSNGAARVDFNHPLAGKVLRYRFGIVEIDPKPAEASAN